MDLFENYKKQPKKLQEICDKWFVLDAMQGLNYKECDYFKKEVEAIGYTFDYELSSEPFNLRKKN
jgi:hypothetical protein